MVLVLASAGLLLGVATLAIWTLAVEEAPRVPAAERVQPADIEHALMLARSHDPRRQRGGFVRALAAEERDVALLLQHAASRWSGAGARVSFEQGRATLNASLPAGLPPIRQFWRRGERPTGWLNLQVELLQARGLPVLNTMRVGRLPLPAWIAEPVARWWLDQRGLGVDFDLPRDVVRHVEFRPQRVIVFYAWRQDTLARMLATLVPPADQLRLRAYSDRLVEALRDATPGTMVSMASLLPPIFELARQRSATPDADPARENRAALLALAFYANQRGLAAIVPAARHWPQPPALTVTLAGRIDTPLHWLISAAVAAESGTPLADAIGLYKEVSDSRGGSGFSFNDLAADRAGTRLGERAVRDPRALQERIARGVTESDLLPDITDLPESLGAETFARRYGDLEAPRFMSTMREIESRLDTLPLLR